MSNVHFLNAEKTQGIQYRPALETDTYVVELGGEKVACEAFFGFRLAEVSPSRAETAVRTLGKADAELVQLGLVNADSAGNEVQQINTSDGGVIKDPAVVVKALQSVIDKAL